MDLKKVLIKCRVASEPNYKATQGLKVATFDVGCHEGRITEFYHAEAFGNVADFVNSTIRKGEKILIIGSLHQQRARTDDGRIVNEVIIIAQTIYILR